MDIEELAFKNRKELANLNELDLLAIIEFLQSDRKEWIYQFSRTHNENVNLQQENTELRIQVSSREEVVNKYGSILEEIREYIDNHTYDDSLDGDGTSLMFEKANGYDLLQIINKYKEEE